MVRTGRAFCLLPVKAVSSRRSGVHTGSDSGPSLEFPSDLGFWPQGSRNKRWVPDMVQEGPGCTLMSSSGASSGDRVGAATPLPSVTVFHQWSILAFPVLFLLHQGNRNLLDGSFCHV